MACAALPVQGNVSSSYGWRQRPSGPDLHTGLDLAAPEGTAVFAALPARVVLAAPSGQLSGYGHVVVLQHSPQLYSLYAHLSRMHVSAGQQLRAGDALGEVGRTAGTREDPSATFGRSGAHLHLEFLSRWPPAGRDLDRLDPAAVLARYGVHVPERGALQRSCGPVLEAEGAAAAEKVQSRGGGAMLLVAAAALYALLSKMKGPVG